DCARPPGEDEIGNRVTGRFEPIGHRGSLMQGALLGKPICAAPAVSLGTSARRSARRPLPMRSWHRAPRTSWRAVPKGSQASSKMTTRVLGYLTGESASHPGETPNQALDLTHLVRFRRVALPASTVDRELLDARGPSEQAETMRIFNFLLYESRLPDE